MTTRNSTTPTPTARERQLQRTLLAIRLGATVFGVLAGVVCYLALDQFTAIGLVPAFVIGLIFALLTRTASASLARDWLVRNASRASDGRRDPPPPRAG
jgi:hypothetical protein